MALSYFPPLLLPLLASLYFRRLIGRSQNGPDSFSSPPRDPPPNGSPASGGSTGVKSDPSEYDDGRRVDADDEPDGGCRLPPNDRNSPPSPDRELDDGLDGRPGV